MTKYGRRPETPTLPHGPADARGGRSGAQGRRQRRQGVPAPTASARRPALRPIGFRRQGHLINLLPDLLVQTNPTATREALDALVKLQKNRRCVVARFIGTPRFKMVIGLLRYETDPLINQWCGDLPVSAQRSDADAMTTPPAGEKTTGSDL